jgi:hypothetical protein
LSTEEEDVPSTGSEQKLEEDEAELREEEEMEAELESAVKEEMKFAEGEVIKKYTLNLAKKVAEFDETKTFSFREAFPAQESFVPECMSVHTPLAYTILPLKPPSHAPFCFRFPILFFLAL